MQVGPAVLHPPITIGVKGKVSIILVELVSLMFKLTWKDRGSLEREYLLLHCKWKLRFSR